jgi:hypothetical protein
MARAGVKRIYRPICWIYCATSGVDIENTVTCQSFTLLLVFLLLALGCSFSFAENSPRPESCLASALLVSRCAIAW